MPLLTSDFTPKYTHFLKKSEGDYLHLTFLKKLNLPVNNGKGRFAEMSLAKCYYSGKGVLEDKEKARELLSQAFEQVSVKCFLDL